MKHFFNFDTLVTHQLLKILYIFIQVYVFYEAYIVMFGFFGYTSLGLLLGIGILIFGSITARVICEILIILFRINDNLNSIRKDKQETL
jgi:hypothetical protein